MLSKSLDGVIYVRVTPDMIALTGGVSKCCSRMA